MRSHPDHKEYKVYHPQRNNLTIVIRHTPPNSRHEQTSVFHNAKAAFKSWQAAQAAGYRRMSMRRVK